MSLNKILTAIFFLLSLSMGYYLYSSIQSTIDEKSLIKEKELAVIEQLKFIRKAQLVHLATKGYYTGSWDSLIQFIEHAQTPVVERREEIIQKDYGGEEIIVHLDTLRFVSAKERIFKQNYIVNASEDGFFVDYKVGIGDKVIKNQRAYSIQIGDKVKQPPFIEDGIISTLADIQPGQTVRKGQVLMTMWDNLFDPNIDVSRIAYKLDSNTKFILFVGSVNKNGLDIDVIEVRDPSPDNPMRSESNEAKNRKPLRFGSRTDVSTAGNWE